ncbi:MAG: transcriptional regulator [Sphingomonas sp.]|nr:transcriptional regulator [Sphingomonas sp.]
MSARPASNEKKVPEAFRTIGELSAELDIPQHRLRYWESRITQLRPVQRAGQRRYYRPEDVALVRRIHLLLNEEGYTINGVRRVLDQEGGGTPTASRTDRSAKRDAAPSAAKLRAVRALLAKALADDLG